MLLIQNVSTDSESSARSGNPSPDPTIFFLATFKKKTQRVQLLGPWLHPVSKRLSEIKSVLEAEVFSGEKECHGPKAELGVVAPSSQST